MSLDRREFLQRAALALGASLSSGCVSAVLGRPPEAPLRPGAPVLSPGRRTTLEALVERILPKNETPGALAAGVPDFIEFVLAEGVRDPERAGFEAGLDRLEALARERHGAGFAAIPAEAQDALLGEVEAAELASLPPPSLLPFGPPVAKPFFAQAKEWTVVGYYTSELGAAHERSYGHYPGRFDGCVPVGPGHKPWLGTS